MNGDKIITVPNVCAGITLLWGGFTANPYSDAFVRNPVLYKPMASLGPEWFWGLLYITVGIAALYLCYKGRAGAEALLLAVAFSLFVTLYFIADPTSLAWAYYLWLAAVNVAFYRGHKWRLTKQQ